MPLTILSGWRFLLRIRKMMFTRVSVPFSFRVPEWGMWYTVMQASPGSISTWVGLGHGTPSGVVSEVSSMNCSRTDSGR